MGHRRSARPQRHAAWLTLLIWFATLGLFLLFLEVVKSARPGAKYVTACTGSYRSKKRRASTACLRMLAVNHWLRAGTKHAS